MKNLLMTLLIVSAVILHLGAYTIETSKGPVELEIPEGYSLEEAYCEMAKLYLEERWDHEKLIVDAKELSDSVDSYIEENRKLREECTTLQNSYDRLVSLYEERTKVKLLQPFMGAHVGSDSEFNSMSFGLDFGAIVLDRFITYTSVSYPWQITLGLDFKI